AVAVHIGDVDSEAERLIAQDVVRLRRLEDLDRRAGEAARTVEDVDATAVRPSLGSDEDIRDSVLCRVSDGAEEAIERGRRSHRLLQLDERGEARSVQDE